MAETRSKAKKTSGDPASFNGNERIVVLHGTESFLKAEYLQQLIEATRKATGNDVDLLTFDGSSCDLAMVLDELRSIGLMAQHKCIVVDGADEFVMNYRSNLERYASSPEPTATLVLRSDTWRAGNIDKLIVKAGQIIACDPITSQQAIARIAVMSKTKHGRAISPAAASLLVDRLGTDMIRLDSELGKLAACSATERPIDVAEVEQLVGRSSSEKAWELQKAILSGNPATALGKLQELSDLAGHHEQLLMIAASDMMRKVARAAQMFAARQNDFTICSQLKIWPQDRQHPILVVARRLGTRKSAALLATLTDYDARGKTGFGEARTNLERFCIQLTHALR